MTKNSLIILVERGNSWEMKSHPHNAFALLDLPVKLPLKFLSAVKIMATKLFGSSSASLLLLHLVPQLLQLDVLHRHGALQLENLQLVLGVRNGQGWGDGGSELSLGQTLSALQDHVLHSADEPTQLSVLLAQTCGCQVILASIILAKTNNC